jgi:adenosylcobinamide-GDP ribazoletransferase
MVRIVGLVSSIRSLIAFLTIIPTGKVTWDLNEFGSVWFLSPIVGVFLGLIVGAIASAVSRVLPNLVIGPFAMGLFTLISGAHHLDGLLDFGDALMVHGSPAKRLEVMHDKTLGAGGFALGFLVPILGITALIPLVPDILFQAIIASEMCAKLAMVVASRFGKSTHQGMGSIVVDVMHNRNGNARLLTSCLISLAIALALLSYAGIAIVMSSIATGVVITAIANKQFNSVTGDVFGAINEISRTACLMTLLAVTR